MAVQEGDADRAVVPIENALEGAWRSRSTRWPARPTDVRIAAEVVHPIHHCVVAAASWTSARSSAWCRIRRPRPSARASCASTCRRRARGRALHRRRGAWCATRTSPGWRSARARGGALRLPRAGRRRRGPPRQRDPLRLARRGGDEVDAGRRGRRPRSCSGAAATSRPAGSWTVLREFADRGVNLTRIESRPRRDRARALHVLRRPRGRGRAAGREALAGLRAQVEELRVLGSYRLVPAGLATLARTVAVRARCSATEAGDSEPGPALALHRGRPARAARHLVRPGAGAQRVVRADQRLHGPPRGRPDPEEPRRDPRGRATGRSTPRASRSPGRS